MALTVFSSLACSAGRSMGSSILRIVYTLEFYHCILFFADDTTHMRVELVYSMVERRRAVVEG